MQTRTTSSMVGVAAAAADGGWVPGVAALMVDEISTEPSCGTGKVLLLIAMYFRWS